MTISARDGHASALRASGIGTLEYVNVLDPMTSNAAGKWSPSPGEIYTGSVYMFVGTSYGGWSATGTYSNKWTFGAGGVVATGNARYPGGSTYQLGDMLVYEDVFDTDRLTMKADIKAVDDDTFGLVLFYDDDPATYPDGPTYVKMVLGTQADRGNNTMYICKSVNGVRTDLASAAVPAIVGGSSTASRLDKSRTHKFTFSYTPGTLTGSIDGHQLISTGVSGVPTRGRCALLNAECDGATYANVCIEQPLAADAVATVAVGRSYAVTLGAMTSANPYYSPDAPVWTVDQGNWSVADGTVTATNNMGYFMNQVRSALSQPLSAWTDVSVTVESGSLGSCQIGLVKESASGGWPSTAGWQQVNLGFNPHTSGVRVYHGATELYASSASSFGSNIATGDILSMTYDGSTVRYYFTRAGETRGSPIYSKAYADPGGNWFFGFLSNSSGNAVSSGGAPSWAVGLPATTFHLDGQEAKSLRLATDGVYEFVQSASDRAAHPLHLYDADGTRLDPTSETSAGGDVTVQYQVAALAALPATYRCETHPQYMRGFIEIADILESTDARWSGPGDATISPSSYDPHHKKSLLLFRASVGDQVTIRFKMGGSQPGHQNSLGLSTHGTWENDNGTQVLWHLYSGHTLIQSDANWTEHEDATMLVTFAEDEWTLVTDVGGTPKTYTIAYDPTSGADADGRFGFYATQYVPLLRGSWSLSWGASATTTVDLAVSDASVSALELHGQDPALDGYDSAYHTTNEFGNISYREVQLWARIVGGGVVNLAPLGVASMIQGYAWHSTSVGALNNEVLTHNSEFHSNAYGTNANYAGNEVAKVRIQLDRSYAASDLLTTVIYNRKDTAREMLTKDILILRSEDGAAVLTEQFGTVPSSTYYLRVDHASLSGITLTTDESSTQITNATGTQVYQRPISSTVLTDALTANPSGAWTKDRGDVPTSGTWNATTSSNTWTFTADGLKCDGNFYHTGSPNRDPATAHLGGDILLLGDFLVYDHTPDHAGGVEVTVDVTPNDDDTWGVILNYDASARTYYKLAIDIQRGKRAHIIKVNGDASRVAKTSASNLAVLQGQADTYTIRLKSRGGLVQAYINGALVGHFTDSSPLSGGKIALANAATGSNGTNGLHAVYKNLRFEYW